jgi:hypothetical protein
MKKLILAIIPIALAGAAVYWFFFHSVRDYPESILPENTAAYVFFPGVDKIQKEASETLLWKKVTSSSRKQLYQYQFERLMKITESVVGVDPRPFFSQLTKDVALAVIPVTGTTQAGALIAYVRKENDTRDFVESRLDPSLKRRIPDLKKAPANYQGYQYYKYSSNTFRRGLNPCYVFLDHHLLFTSSEVGMKILLDVKAKKLPSLKKNSVFRDAKDEVHFEKGLLVFVNAKTALDMMRNRLPSRVQPYWPAFLKVSGVEAVRGFAYRLGFKGEGFSEEAFVTVDEKRQGFAKAYMQQRPRKLSGLIFLPSGSHAAGAGTLPDGMLVWKEIQAQIQSVLSGNQFSQWRAMLELIASYLNFNFQRDLVEPLGNQFAFAYHSFAGPDAKEKMRLFVALELKNPDHFRTVVEKLLAAGEQRGFSRRAELYQGRTLQLLQMQEGQMQAAPALWIEGSWFYFGSDHDFVRQSIDAVKSKKNLSENEDFQKVTKDFPPEVNSISYTNTQATMQRYAAMLRQQSNEEERAWIRQYGLTEELDELSKNLFGSGSYTVIEKKGIRYHAYSSVPTMFYLLPALLSARQ